MELKRPSMFTILITLGVVLVLFAIVMIIVTTVSKDSGSTSLSMDKIASISGEENVVIDSDGNRINSSKGILSQKSVDGFIFDSLDVSTNDGISTLTFEIYNPNSEDKKLGEYELKILDQYSNIIGRITDNAETIEGLSRKQVSLQIKGDIANLTDIQISKIVYKQI